MHDVVLGGVMARCYAMEARQGRGGSALWRGGWRLRAWAQAGGQTEVEWALTWTTTQSIGESRKWEAGRTNGPTGWRAEG